MRYLFMALFALLIIIFKALFTLLAVIYTMIEAIMIYIGGIIYFIWALKWPKNLWQRTHNGRSRQILDFVGYFYSDNNIFHTIKRRVLYNIIDTSTTVFAVMDGKLLNHDDTTKLYKLAKLL